MTCTETMGLNSEKSVLPHLLQHYNLRAFHRRFFPIFLLMSPHLLLFFPAERMAQTIRDHLTPTWVCLRRLFTRSVQGDLAGAPDANSL